MAALRLGTQELVRRGFGPTDMPDIASLIARVLADDEPPSDVLVEVTALRHRGARARA